MKASDLSTKTMNFCLKLFAGMTLFCVLIACTTTGNLVFTGMLSTQSTSIPSNEYLYVSGGSDTYSYKVDPATGSLTALTTGTLPLLWFNSTLPWFKTTMLSTFMTGFDIGGSNVQVYNIDSSLGTMTTPAGMPVNLSGRAWNYDGFMDPTHRFMYYPVLSSQTIYGFTYNNTSPYLHQASWVSTTMANSFFGQAEQTFMVFDRTGNYAFISCTDGTNYYVDVYKIDQTTGALTPVHTSTYYASTSNINGLITDPSGSVLFVQSISNPYTITSYLIGANGTLTLAGTQAQASSTVADMTFNSTLNALYVHQDSGYAQIINVDLSTGAMTLVGNNPTRSDLMWLGMDPTNTYSCATTTTGFGFAKFDSVSHQFTMVNTIAGVFPIACSFSRNGNFLFAAHDANVSTVYAFSYDSSGNLTQVGSGLPGPAWPAFAVTIGVPTQQ